MIDWNFQKLGSENVWVIDSRLVPEYCSLNIHISTSTIWCTVEKHKNNLFCCRVSLEEVNWMCLTWWGKRFPSRCYSCWLWCCASLMSSDWALSVWCVVDPVGWTVNLRRSAGLPQQYACMTVWMCHSLCGVLHLGQTMASFSILSLPRPALSPWHPCHATPCPPVWPGFALVLAVGTAGFR